MDLTRHSGRATWTERAGDWLYYYGVSTFWYTLLVSVCGSGLVWFLMAVSESQQDRERRTCAVLQAISKVPVRFQPGKYGGHNYCIVETSPGVHILIKAEM